MYYQPYRNPMMQKHNIMTTNYTTVIDPFVIEALKMVIDRSVVIETVRGNLQGILVDVKPDHIVVKPHGNDTTFFVRIQQIVYIMPDID
ncbi:YuzF family protein [Tepidibacter mesophilus]|uniref:YuzF family protein n=1 Tax=Tepidibacter mesophilus TaxID=655607 RepID=UPI001A9A4887|nr:YuzF family protein [Tepidibacter mesophilus]